MKAFWLILLNELFVAWQRKCHGLHLGRQFVKKTLHTVFLEYLTCTCLWYTEKAIGHLLGYWKHGRFKMPKCILATHPLRFAGSANVVPFPSKPDRQPYSMANRGLRIELPVLNSSHNLDIYPTFPFAILDCHYENDFSCAIKIPLEETGTSSVFMRLLVNTRNGSNGGKFSAEQMAKTEIRTIYITKQLLDKPEVWSRKCLLHSKSTEAYGYKIIQVGPKCFRWHQEAMVLDMMSLKDTYKRASVVVTTNFVFCSDDRNHCFAVILAVQGLLRRGKEKESWSLSVGFLLRLKGVVMNDWLEQCNRARIDFTMNSKRHDMVQLPDLSCEESPLIVSANASEEEILNQKIIVLDIRI
jgi:hypothetical protein